ncbi:MAG TPA: flagellar biosynthesis anti-sigma factor FlgM [Candidatus Hydrogenedentes bacterium]|nr:flagellar biosynthesis anti-sigma factor FlgM [Candidatus Hydrogenedentota bacterium]
MVGVQGVGGIPEPTPERPVNSRDKRRDEAVASAAQSSDDVLISSAAQAAAKLTGLVALAQTDDIRQDRVEQAKQALDRGDHKNPDIVAKLAERISKFL